jgi:hypothetical protein
MVSLVSQALLASAQAQAQGEAALLASLLVRLA